jgi:uncharacterized protein (TIGR02466 family)
MQVLPVFAVPVAKIDAPQFLEVCKPLFDGRVALQPCTEGHSTSLTGYFDANNPVDIEGIEPFKKFLCVMAMDYIKTIGYKASVYEARVANIWINEMVSGGVHKKHSHYGNHLSGCYYIEMPKNSAGITLYSFLERFDKMDIEIENHNHFNSSAFTCPVKEGDLLMWESYLKHEVIASEFEGKRRSIAFDILLSKIPQKQ